MGTVIAENNGVNGPLVYALTPGIIGRLQKTSRFTGSTGAMSDRILTSAPQFASGMQFDGREIISENNLPQALTKGSNRDCHAMICGWFPGIRMPYFSGLEIVSDPYTGLESQQVKIYIRQAYDILPDHVDYMSVCVDARK